MLSHLLYYVGDIDGAHQDVVVLEDKHKLMLNLLHYVLDVLRETESRLSLLDDDPFIPFVLQCINA